MRRFLRREEDRLRIRYRLGASGQQTARARARVHDALIRHVFAAASAVHAHARARPTELPERIACAVVAVGGYARNELAPCSDLDLLFLHHERAHPATRELIERVLQQLWDAGLSIGQRSHTVRDCVTTARGDAHFQTALVGARLVAGDNELMRQLDDARTRQRRKSADSFIAAVRRARDERHAKHGGHVLLQEPNVKDGVGALRDLHDALWAADARWGCPTLEALRDAGHIALDEYARAARAYELLLRLRQEAHWLSRRKTDRLALDLQTTLAARFGYLTTPHLFASEQLMRDYYRRARELHSISAAVLERAAAATKKRANTVATTALRIMRPRREHLAEAFIIEEGELRLAGDASVFTPRPLLAFEAVALAQAAGVGFSHELRAAIRAQLPRFDRELRASPEAASLFMSLLRGRGRVGHALRLLHETGLLSRFLPEFSRISLLIQHDLYHHYTVDEHTLRAVEALDELMSTPLNSLTTTNAPHLSHRAHLRAACERVHDVALLYLALLLHDIGKGRGRGHVERGARISERVCARLKLAPGAATKVVQLVRQHVLMAQVSQRRDLRDPRTAADFAAHLNDHDELDMLWLLTYADVNAVAPGVWSEWKGALLHELHARAAMHFAGSDAHRVAAEATTETAVLRARVRELLADELPAHELERHFALLPERYARALHADDVAAHLRLIVRLAEAPPLACRWRAHPTAGAATELTVAALDRRRLFADLAGTLAAQGVEILRAELDTHADGVALDTFILRSAATRAAVERERWPPLEQALRVGLSSTPAEIEAAVERWSTRHAPRRINRQMNGAAAVERPRAPTVVRCSNEIAEATTVVEVNAADAHGLAYRLAHVIAERGLDITCAQVATEKSDALDVFYVTAEGGRKLTVDEMRELEAALCASLAGEAPPESAAS